MALGAAALAGLLAITRARSALPGGRFGSGRRGSIPSLIALVASRVPVMVVWLHQDRADGARPRCSSSSYFRRRNFTLPMVSAALVQFAYMGGFVVTPALLGARSTGSASAPSR